jgi:hypothetical protein
VDRESAEARKRDEAAETAIEQEQEAMGNGAMTELTTRQPETTYAQMLNGIGDSLSNLASPTMRSMWKPMKMIQNILHWER